MGKLGMQEGEDIQHPWINKAVANAQKKVESMNFDIRKQVLDYDNVMNKQREAIYRLRNAILEGDDISGRVKQMVEESVADHVAQYAPKGADQRAWDIPSLRAWLKSSYGIDWTVPDDEIHDIHNLEDRVKELTTKAYEDRHNSLGAETFLDIQRNVLIAIIDSVWVEHLTYLEQLRKGIFLRAYGQKDPLIEFQKEGYRLFETMMIRVSDTAIDYVFRMSQTAAQESAAESALTSKMIPQKEEFSIDHFQQSAAPDAQQSAGVVPMPTKGANLPKPKPITVDKIGRNDPCPCGSGKKYKKCHAK
jgi:preprotein translocase subunit SecA